MATRCGTANSGISAHVRGWNVGINSEVTVCEKCGGDAVFCYVTGGSNNSSILDSGLTLSFCPECGGRTGTMVPLAASLRTKRSSLRNCGRSTLKTRRRQC